MTAVYLAGPSAELDRVRAAAAAIDAAGHVITCRWFDVIEHDREGRPTDAGSTRATLVRAWRANTAGIRHAEIVVALALAGGGLSPGTREEVAYAEGVGEVLVRVIGDPYPSLVGCATCCVETVEEALR